MAKAKGKKGKSESKQAKLAEKKQKQEKKADKKSKSKASKNNGDVDSDDDVDLDAVLEEMRLQQEQHHRITETVLDAPPPVSSYASFLANPVNSNQLLLFGGELYDGARASFFNKLYVYYIDKDEWRSITSPNAPLPRSSHAWCRGGNDSKSIYLFGGEFSSPKQGTFYHYSDFWKLDCSTKEWTRVETKGKSPPARSGHRLTYYKQYIILFGGFQETTGDHKYLGDVWIYDTTNFVWHTPSLPPAQLKPDPRSSFTFLPHDQGAVLYGGFSRVKVNPGAGKGGQQSGKKSKGGGYGAKMTKVVGMIHTDCFFLRVTPPPSDAPQGALPTVRWERRKKPANAPNPPRTGAAMAFHKGRGIMFGGVHDHEETEEDVDSDFFNQLFAWNIERNRFFPLGLRKPRTNNAGKKGGGGGGERGGRRGNRQANEEELLRSLAKLTAGGGGGGGDDDDDVMDIDLPGEQEPDEPPARKEFPVSNELPHARFNAQLAVQDDVLYIYGGIMDKGGRDVVFDDMYAIDLGKLDGCKEIFNRPLPDWIESEDEDDDDEDDDEEDHSDSEEEEDEGEDEEMEDGVEKNNSKPFTPSKRGRKTPASSAADAESTPSEREDGEAETAAAAAEEQEEVVDDGLPHPRPFESRRDFFQRTSNEWQEILMTNLRWKNIQPETLSIKEIKSKAFELSEEKWWDCREEITAMEDEQEAAGIGEVVSLADRAEGGGHGGGAARRR
ncbi:Kelch repeat-containing protein 3 [Podospora pseudoanserina]|uniref:Kelch repeat-containing protein 3 n=1 Tax=Podospora pseudoanserina TaxID=2609844 RepID=A0ABR0IMY0_9PEZI|nr:Kelch repeat-containing protein 3 [Podospora pseudoanserina]